MITLEAEDHTLEAAELACVKRAFEQCRGNMSQTAKLVDVDRRTLYRKIHRWIRLGKWPFRAFGLGGAVSGRVDVTKPNLSNGPKAAAEEGPHILSHSETPQGGHW